MNHLESIIWLLGWPVLIIITYQLIKYFLKKMKFM